MTDPLGGARRRWLRGTIGALVALVGVVCLAGSVAGRLLLESDEANSYADPREPLALDIGTYSLDWLGPVGRATVPSYDEVDIDVVPRSGEATLAPPQRSGFAPEGPSTISSAMGTLNVLEAGEFQLVYEGAEDLDGHPRLRTAHRPRANGGVDPNLATVGAVLTLGGASILWGLRTR